MKLLVLASFLTFLIGCSSNRNRNPYDESNYTVVRTDSFEGTIDRQLFIYNYDTARKMAINFSPSGKILAKGFYYNGKPDGKMEINNMDGKLLQVDSFIDGKKVYSKQYFIPDTSVKLLRNGKFEPFTSIDSLR